MSEERIVCEGHGSQQAVLACLHLVEAGPDEPLIGFHWSNDDGDWVANCDACQELCDDEGFFPDDLVEETFVVIWKKCLDEIALVNGVDLAVAGLK